MVRKQLPSERDCRDESKTSRRSLLGRGLLGLTGLSLVKSISGCSQASSSSVDRHSSSLADLRGLSLSAKVELLQRVYEREAFHESGIMYSMMRLDNGIIRPFVPDDFHGQIGLDATVGKLQLDGPWDYLHGENSITVSGQYMVAQTCRFLVTKSPEARQQARRAFRSLDLIYRMGEDAKKPGWLNKPYGFRPSNQTVPDQYLDACWGLFTYRQIAEPAERKRVDQMLIGFADYWRSVDYVLTYFGSSWDLKPETDSYNAIYAMINALAYHCSHDPVHLREFERFMATATWTRQTRIDGLREQVRRRIQEHGKPEVIPYGFAFGIAKDLLRPGEFLCLETTVHNKFVAVAAGLIDQVMPSSLAGRLPQILAMWWREWRYGIGQDFLPYYWFAVDLTNDTWRPLPSTALLPRGQWPFGDPFAAYVSRVRWNDPLARFMVTSVLAVEHKAENAASARTVGRQMLEAIDEQRLHWLLDPDGLQLVPEIRYYGQCLSSEVPSSFLTAYWKGRHLRCW